MVKGQFANLVICATVLAAVIIACVDIDAREGHVVDTTLNGDVAQQPDDRRQLEGYRDGPHFAVVLGYHLNLTLTQHRDRLAPIDHLQRLVRRGQQQCLFHARLHPFSPKGERSVKTALRASLRFSDKMPEKQGRIATAAQLLVAGTFGTSNV